MIFNLPKDTLNRRRNGSDWASGEVEYGKRPQQEPAATNKNSASSATKNVMPAITASETDDDVMEIEELTMISDDYYPLEKDRNDAESNKIQNAASRSDDLIKMKTTADLTNDSKVPPVSKSSNSEWISASPSASPPGPSKKKLVVAIQAPVLKSSAQTMLDDSDNEEKDFIFEEDLREAFNKSLLPSDPSHASKM